MKHALLGIGLGLAASAALAAPTATQPAPSARMDFQLPLPGESIPPEGGGLLVQTDSSIRQVVFRWTGPDKGSAEGNVQFEGFFQAQTGALKPGSWTLEAQGFDAQGRLVARRSTTFQVGSTPIPGAIEDAVANARVMQDFYISVDAGTKFGVGENDLRSYRSLELLSDGNRQPGPAMEPYDRILSGNATMAYQLQQGPFRLKVRGSSDLSETWGHSASPSRIGADLHWNSWAEAHLGDQYPAWNQLLMDGVRVRGVGMGLAAIDDGSPVARVDFAIGSLRPSIDPQIRSWGDAIDTIPAQFRRSFQAVRIGLGDGAPVGWNLVFLHSADRVSGVDLPLHDSLGGQTPRENLAVGTDLVTRLWKNRIEAYAGAALAITTDDTRQNSVMDSLRDAEDIPLPGFLDDLINVNLTTRGVERLSYGGADVGGFFWDNMAVRTGARLLVPLGATNRLRLESRWIHVGSQFQSFARSVQESPRTGIEWSSSVALARDALLLSLSGSETNTHPALGESVPSHSIFMNMSLTPPNAPIGWYAQSGVVNSGGGEESRSEAWNTGSGFFGNVRTSGAGNLHWRAGYGFFENSVKTSVSDIDTSSAAGRDSIVFSQRQFLSTVRTHSLDANLRWRPVRDFETRSGYMLASMGMPGDTTVSGQTQTHRIQGGFSFWRLSHRLETALDGSVVLRPDQPGPDATSWDQSVRVSWELAASQTVRLSQRWALLAGGRQDLRFDLGWEAWF